MSAHYTHSGISIVSAENNELLTVCTEPADDNRHAGVGSCGREEQGCILKVHVVVYDEQDRKSSDRYGGRNKGEDKAMTDQI